MQSPSGESAEKLPCHILPPAPVVHEAFPHVEKMRNYFDSERVSHAYVLVEQRVVIADTEDVVVVPEVLVKPGIVVTGQIGERAVEECVVVVKAVKETLRDV